MGDVAFAQAWSSIEKSKEDRDRNTRDYVELGRSDPYGVVAYPLGSSDNELRMDAWRNYRKPRPHNIEAFRNISRAPHYGPGYMDDGTFRTDTGVLSVERGVPIAIANALPIEDPFFRLNQNKQRDAWHGSKSSKGRANRTAHMWAAGNLSREQLENYITGDMSPNEVVGMTDDLMLMRNPYGDTMMSWITGQGDDIDLVQAPRYSYTVYDIMNNTLPYKDKWKPENRLPLRDDIAYPWRDKRSFRVTGSVDPLLQIPLEWSDMQPTREGQKYIEFTDPTGYTHEGIPVPTELSMDERSGLGRGIATGSHGLYFDPNDLVGSGKEIWNEAMTGDIVRRSLDSFWEENL